MSQESPHVIRDLIFRHIEVDQAISGVSPARVIEIMVERKKGRPIYLVQERDDFIVFYPEPSDVFSHAPNTDSPRVEQPALAFGNVFIQ